MGQGFKANSVRKGWCRVVNSCEHEKVHHVKPYYLRVLILRFHISSMEIPGGDQIRNDCLNKCQEKQTSEQHQPQDYYQNTIYFSSIRSC